MAIRPWEIQSNMETKGQSGNSVVFKIVSKDMKKLAESLGANNEGEDLAKKAKEMALSYIKTPKDSSEWLLGEKKYSWQDLFEAFTHGSRIAKDENSLCLSEMAYDDANGHHKKLYNPIMTFQAILARCFFLAATFSTECDRLIRWELYNNDWLYYFCQISPSSREMVKLLDKRSLDFFLPDVRSKEWDSNWNVPALFDQIQSLCSALKILGRNEEAETLQIELTERKVAFGILSNDILPVQARNEIRLSAEKAWVQYFGLVTWEAIHPESRSDLIDAFSAERAVNAGYYKSWRYVLQSMLYVIERELNISFFAILKKVIDPSTSFVPCNSRAASRQKTFESIIRAIESGKLLTLGELSFVLNYWEDPIMDNCTNLFKDARTLLEQIAGPSHIHVQAIRSAFKETFGQVKPPWDLVKLRNSCAHPGNEGPLRDKMMFVRLKEILGEPPRMLINTVVVQLRGIKNVSQKYDEEIIECPTERSSGN